MILRGNMSPTSSRTYSWIAVALGALLLPLVPTWAQPQQEKTPPSRLTNGDKAETQTKEPAPVNRRTTAFQELSRSAAEALVQELRPTGEGGQDNLEKRLQELEKLLAEVQKEIDALRHERAGRRGSERAASKKYGSIDLQPWGNQQLDESFHSGKYPGNNLASLPKGRVSLAGIPFTIGKQLLQLGPRSDKPEKIEGIKLNRKFARLYFLHATGYIGEEDKQIAEYTVHYGDGSSATIPVEYGKDVLDWWNYPASPDPTRGKVAWNGENEPARKEFDAGIRLYMCTWANPKPNVQITSIDYAMTNGEMTCLPFCVAMTGEEGPVKVSNATR